MVQGVVVLGWCSWFLLFVFACRLSVAYCSCRCLVVGVVCVCCCLLQVLVAHYWLIVDVACRVFDVVGVLSLVVCDVG